MPDVSSVARRTRPSACGSSTAPSRTPSAPLTTCAPSWRCPTASTRSPVRSTRPSSSSTSPTAPCCAPSSTTYYVSSLALLPTASLRQQLVGQHRHRLPRPRCARYEVDAYVGRERGRRDMAELREELIHPRRGRGARWRGGSVQSGVRPAGSAAARAGAIVRAAARLRRAMRAHLVEAWQRCHLGESSRDASRRARVATATGAGRRRRSPRPQHGTRWPHRASDAGGRPSAAQTRSLDAASRARGVAARRRAGGVGLHLPGVAPRGPGPGERVELRSAAAARAALPPLPSPSTPRAAALRHLAILRAGEQAHLDQDAAAVRVLLAALLPAGQRRAWRRTWARCCAATGS